MFYFLPLLLFTLLFQDILGILPVGSPLTSSISSSITSSLAATPPSPAGTSSIPGMNANALPFYPTSDTVESVIGNFAFVTYENRAPSAMDQGMRLGISWVLQWPADFRVWRRWQIAEACSVTVTHLMFPAGHFGWHSPTGPTEGHSQCHLV